MDPDAFSLRPVMIAVAVLSFAFLIPAVGVRAFTRGYLLKKMGWEDCKLAFRRWAGCKLTVCKIPYSWHS